MFLTYLFEKMQMAPSYESVEKAIKMLGDDGLYIVAVTAFLKTLFNDSSRIGLVCKILRTIK
jgi:hypothetical protein